MSKELNASLLRKLKDELYDVEKELELTKSKLLKTEIELANISSDYVKEHKALEIIKKAFKSSSTYTYKLKDSLECGWITKEEYELLEEVVL